MSGQDGRRNISVVGFILVEQKKSEQSTLLVHKINQRRSKYGEYHHLMKQVLSEEEKCLSYIRMTPSTFQLLLQRVGPIERSGLDTALLF